MEKVVFIYGEDEWKTTTGNREWWLVHGPHLIRKIANNMEQDVLHTLASMMMTEALFRGITPDGFKRSIATLGPAYEKSYAEVLALYYEEGQKSAVNK